MSSAIPTDSAATVNSTTPVNPNTLANADALQTPASLRILVPPTPMPTPTPMLALPLLTALPPIQRLRALPCVPSHKLGSPGRHRPPLKRSSPDRHSSRGRRPRHCPRLSTRQHGSTPPLRSTKWRRARRIHAVKSAGSSSCSSSSPCCAAWAEVSAGRPSWNRSHVRALAPTTTCRPDVAGTVRRRCRTKTSHPVPQRRIPPSRAIPSPRKRPPVTNGTRIPVSGHCRP